MVNKKLSKAERRTLRNAPAPEVTAPVSETVVETSTTDAPAAEPVAQAETVKAAPVYWVNDERTFTPRRGFETVLYAALSGGQFTEAEVVDRLLASGEFARVAPKAAELRPVKPTRFLLKVWTASKVLKTTAR